jgi:hypothetical protein
MSEAADARHPVPMSQVLSLLGLARQYKLGAGERELVAGMYPRLRPYLVEILHGVITPDVNTPETLLAPG